MLSHSYLITGPNQPDDFGAAIATQRQSIPLAWAIAVSSPTTRFHTGEGHYYFATTIGEALAQLDRAMASWGYNSYFRDVFAPVAVYRRWLADRTSETALYLNISELIINSPTQARDVMELHRLQEKIDNALHEIDQRNFSSFISELRKVAYPLVTVPVTGNRKRDAELLSLEMRDARTVEAELALQVVGVDRARTMLREATQAVQLRTAPHEVSDEFLQDDIVSAHRLMTRDIAWARRLLVEELGCAVMREDDNHLILDAHGHEFVVEAISTAAEITVEGGEE